MAALEAMACEVPVVASRIGGLPEVIEDGETGFLCALDDIDHMVARGESVLKDPQLRQRIGRAGHAVGETSKGRLFPKHRGDLLEAAVVARRMREAAIEALHVPDNPLDVLAQQIVAMVAMQEVPVRALVEQRVRAASGRGDP